MRRDSGPLRSGVGGIPCLFIFAVSLAAFVKVVGGREKETDSVFALAMLLRARQSMG